jgi:pimeloyl-ACP methyl ester carboxylesterase
LTRSGASITAALAGALGLYGYYTYLGLSTPLPGQDQDVSQGLDAERHEFETADGLTLRLKRYANPEGIPVLMCHGFGGCGTCFDLPRENRNMAVFLAREGFDVWISSFRGCGHEPYDSDGGDWTHTIDDLAVYDAPALVDGVSTATGKPVFYVGHSMGGEVLYMYLQGARFEDGHVVSDPALVTERHRKLAGGITMGSPPAFEYERSNPYHRVFKSKLGTAVINAMNQQMLVKEVTSPRVEGAGAATGLLLDHPRLLMAASRSPFTIPTYCRRNTDKDATTSLAKWGTGDASAGMYVQLFQSLLEGPFMEHPGRTEPDSRYSYTDNMDLISLPMFFMTGTADFANCKSIRRYGYEQVSSPIKEYVCLNGYGHTDMLMGKNVEQDVYEVLAGWMKAVAREKPRTG